MCGIVGFIDLSVQNPEQLLQNMSAAIAHRGPDDSGVLYDRDSGIGLGHCRLSILDLSPAGHQPMVSASGRYVILFNGEIYNHLEMRKALEPPPPLGIGGEALASWRGHSDTETLLAGFDVWGVESTIKKTIGMFAIAVWDRENHILTMARDRIGEKPLYYGWQGHSFLFASELKALRPHPSFQGKISRDALALLLRYNYIPAPYSIYEGIAKLQAGCMLSVSLRQPDPKVWAYWSTVQVTKECVAHPFAGSPADAVDELETLLKDAVRLQMQADVPLGAFLSGGVDSSTVVALMQAQSSRPVKTFTIGYSNKGYNEAAHAKAVARHLRTEHTELYVSPQQAMEVIPRLPGLYCEPFADASQIPTFLLSQLARQHVTVSLSGDAGDELFCGYNRYLMTNSFWRWLSPVPMPLRVLAARGITSISPDNLNRMARYLPGAARYALIGDKLHKGADVMASRTVEDLYLAMVSHERNPEDLVIGAKEAHVPLPLPFPDLGGLKDVERMMALDTISYLPDDILVKVDRAAMGCSLESRVPFLDHRVVKFAWSLPLGYKLRDGQTKWPLRQVLNRYVPRELINRPKMGFAVPIDDWLRGPLRDWAEELLGEERLLREGYFHPGPIRHMWAEHLSRSRNWTTRLWCLLMFQAWLAGQGGGGH